MAVLSNKLIPLGSSMRILLVWGAYLLLTPSPALAQPAPEELRKIARNPFADEIKLTFEEDFTFNQGPYDRSANSLEIQPVIPLSIMGDWLLVARVVATAIAYQPDSLARSGGTTGLGDTTSSFFLTPAHTGKLIWGVGPAVLMPTATSNPLGAGKWGVGPTGAVLVEPEWGSVGVLVENIWSVAGGSNRSPVNQLQIEPLFSYNLPRGWYLTSNPTIVADWTQPTTERWLLPIGGGAGRSFSIRKQAADSNLTLYWNAIRPANQFSPKWQLILEFTFLFPIPKHSITGYEIRSR
ncbi:MAG TPA: hypothetical protein VK829_11270 [Terriglobales bacterium]|nr:hypothetical protein [Terriglobales bacterium]